MGVEISFRTSPLSDSDHPARVWLETIQRELLVGAMYGSTSRFILSQQVVTFPQPSDFYGPRKPQEKIRID